MGLQMLRMPQMARLGKNRYGDPKPKKKCDKCKEELREHFFSMVDKKDSSKGRRSRCKKCSAEKAKVERERRANDWKHQPALAMLNNSKQRAKNAGLAHTLSLDDIVIPDYCPVLGIKLETGDRKDHFNAPSIDRIDNSRGYTPNNIVVMSCRANMLKKDGSLEDLVKLGEWARALLN